jgi:hypothetical protein
MWKQVPGCDGDGPKRLSGGLAIKSRSMQSTPHPYTLYPQSRPIQPRICTTRDRWAAAGGAAPRSSRRVMVMGRCDILLSQ